MNIEFNMFNWGPLLTLCKVNNEDFTELKNACYRANRVHITDITKLKKENIFTENDTEYFKNVLQKYFDGYMGVYNNYWSERNFSRRLTLETIWVNFQQEGEFRPPHVHHNCDASFVIYIDMPDVIKSEHRDDVADDIQPGNITFQLSERPGRSDLIPNICQVTKFPTAGDMYIFPYNLEHFTMPFKSDVSRISVSGNLVFE